MTTVYPIYTTGVHGNSGDKTAGKHLFPNRKGRKFPEISGKRYSGFLWEQDAEGSIPVTRAKIADSSAHESRKVGMLCVFCYNGENKMFVANDSKGKRVDSIEANKGNMYFCTICGEEAELKRGEINAPHFAHLKGACSDNWVYDMSWWHRNMQNYFPQESREVIVKHNDRRHL